MNPVFYVDTGVANLASVTAAFARLGRRCAEANSRDVDAAELLVVPGVGNYGAAVRTLQQRGLFEPLRRRVQRGRPTLGICLGMQLMCSGSEEAAQAPGIGALPGSLRRFPAGVRAPQMGWNRVASNGGAVPDGVAYFANSYALPAQSSPGWQLASCRHGVDFVAAAQRGAVLLCQFHPELSGRYGADLLRGWLTTATREEVTPC